MHNLRRKGAALLTIFVLAASPAVTAPSAFAQVSETPVSIYIDGAVQTFDPAPVMKDSRVYLPMKALFEALGATVTWNEKTQEVTAVKEEQTIVLPLNKPYAYINGVIIQLETPAYEADGHTMVSVRFAAESLGIQINWDGTQNQVNVITKPVADPSQNSTSTTNNKPTAKVEQDGTLNYDDAAVLAVRNNQSYYNLQVSLGKVEDANDRLYISPGTYSAAMIQQKDNLNLNEKWMEQQLGLVAQGLSVNTKNQMDQISMLKEKLSLLQSTKKYQDYALQMAQLKYDNGMLSKLELDALKSKADQTVVNIDLCKTNIEAGYLALNAAIERDLKERDDLEYSFAYKPVTAGELEEKLRNSASEDPYLWYAKQNLSLEDYKLKTYDYMVDYYQNGLSYPVAEMNLTVAKNNVKQVEKSLNDEIQVRYNKLQQLELSISQKKMTLEDALRNENAMKSKLNAGMATKAELMEAELAIPSTIQEIRELQLQHAQLRTVFEQPYLQPDYFSGSGSGE